MMKILNSSGDDAAVTSPIASLLIAVRMTLATVVLCAVIYPLCVTALGHVAFPQQAAGSLLVDGTEIRGARLVGQQFTKPQYFHGRPSAAGNGYDPTSTGGTNLGPTSKKLLDKTDAALVAIRLENPAHAAEPVPAELVATSGSGIDPFLSPPAVRFQSERVAQARGVSVHYVEALIERYTQARVLAIFGEPRVNILLLNRALDAQERHS